MTFSILSQKSSTPISLLRWIIICFSLLVLIDNGNQLYAQTLAFPGAAGYGRFAVGGRGGKIIEVTNLNDSGPGSLREAVETPGPRIIVFKVGGTIELTSQLMFDEPYLTLAGQTAPGDGILITGVSVIFRASETVIRGIRIRTGDQNQGSDWDAVGMTARDGDLTNFVMDRSSVSWGIDENFGLNGSPDSRINGITIQNCIVAEGLRNSHHSKGAHSMNFLMNSGDVVNVSFINNILANSTGRSILVGPEGNSAEMINNVIYNWENYATRVGIGSFGNVIGNFYKTGPDTKTSSAGDEMKAVNGDGSIYALDNILEKPGYTLLGDDAVHNSVVLASSPVMTPSGHQALPASQVADYVLENSGAYPLCVVDTRIIDGILNNTGKIIDSPTDIGGMPVMNSGTPPTDSDGDGMSDAWENDHNLDPNDSSDGNLDQDGDGYTNVEEYLNSLFGATQPSPPPPSNTPPTISSIADQEIDENQVLGPIDFTINDAETNASGLTVSASSSNTNLVALNDIDISGNNSDRNITVTPNQDAFGTTTITVTVSDGSMQTSTSFELVVNEVVSGNTPPTISSIADQEIDENQVMGPIDFTVNDAETNASGLTVSVSSSNTNLVALNGLDISGSNSTRNISVTPIPDAFGTTTITLTVSDGSMQTSTSFELVVNEVVPSNTPPTISSIDDQEIDQDQVMGPIDFTISDAETNASSLTVSVSSSNTNLVALNDIDISGTNSNRNITITPDQGDFGTTTITLTVSDGSMQTSTSFELVVNEVVPSNTPPTISSIDDQEIDQNQVMGPIDFTINDAETNASDLTVSVSSSNTNLVALNDIDISGTNSNRNITATPKQDATGNVTVTVRVSDGSMQTSTSFDLKVNGDGGTVEGLSATMNSSDLTCHDANDGTLTVSVSGGVEPYSYLWSNSATTASIDNLSPGTYSVTITDAASNSLTKNASIAAPAPLAITEAITDPSCQGTDGAIDVEVAGGTAPYTYNWSTGDNGETISNIGSGSYSVVVTDAQGCSIEENFNLESSTSWTVTESIIDASCGANNGSIDIEVSGTTGAISYAWSNGESTQNIENLSAGDYSVTITDGNGCTVHKSFTLESIDASFSFEVSIENTVCGASTGSISVSANGGVAPYQYFWNNGATTNAIQNLSAGTYTVTIEDQTGCTKIASFVVNSSEGEAQFDVSADITDESCSGNDGAFSLSVTGGVEPYIFEWNHGVSGNSISNLAAGSYSVRITDAHGCYYDWSGEINSMSAVEEPLISSDNGVLQTSTNYAGSVDYQWFKDDTEIEDATSSSWTPSESGKYSLRVTGENGCFAYSDKLWVAMDGDESSYRISSIDIYPVPATTELNLDIILKRESNVGYRIHKLDGMRVIGQAPGKFENEYSTSIDVSDLAPGVYVITIKVSDEIVSRTFIVE